MKLQGISDKGISRIARSMKSQDLGEPDYGEAVEEDWGNEGDSLERVRKRFEEAGAEWTPEGWTSSKRLDLSNLRLTRLPKIS